MHWPVLRHLLKAYTYLSTGYAVRHSEIVTAVSAGVFETLWPDYRSRPNFEVVYSGVPLNTAPTIEECDELRRELGLAANTPLILHAGRFVPQKNHFGLIAIFKEVLKSLPTARLLLVGDGPLFSAVEQKIASDGLRDQILLLGSRDDVPRLMRSSNVLVLPSFFEGLPVVGLEAMSSRLPLVASDIPGVRNELVQNGETGFIHPIADISGMAASVVRIIQEPELAQRLARPAVLSLKQIFRLKRPQRGISECTGAASESGAIKPQIRIFPPRKLAA